MQKNKKKVMVFGTFDYFHAGHENLFEQAKKLGDYLIVIVARDETVKTIKGENPKYSEKKRLKTVEKHPLVDKAILGEIENKYKVIQKWKPDIIALGYDQFVFTYRLEKIIIDAKLNTEIHRLNPYKPEIFKSSLMKAKENKTFLE